MYLHTLKNTITIPHIYFTITHIISSLSPLAQVHLHNFLKSALDPALTQVYYIVVNKQPTHTRKKGDNKNDKPNKSRATA